MADALTKNQGWFDHTYIEFVAESGTAVQMRTKTTSINITGANFDMESNETFGGAIKRYGAREDFEISFDGIVTSHQDFDWVFHGANQTDTSITSSSIKDYRVTLLWTDQTGITAASQAIDTASEAYREYYAECNMVSLEKSQNVGENITASLTFKTAFEDKDGEINFKFEVCGTDSALAAANAYTSTTKW
ncbi:MAG: hypothetical protein ACTSR3_05680 [Candidatus Helarchaeota archaeon]